MRIYYNYKQNNCLKLLSIIVFIYNNSIYLSIKKAFYKLLTNYIVNFANISISRLLTKKILLATKQTK